MFQGADFNYIIKSNPINGLMYDFQPNYSHGLARI